MLIHYRGGRTHIRVTFGRRPFNFTKENKHTLDIKDQEVRDFIFQLPNSFEFEAIEREQVKQPIKDNVIVKKGVKNVQDEY